jgi:hypothetical protein
MPLDTPYTPHIPSHIRLKYTTLHDRYHWRETLSFTYGAGALTVAVRLFKYGERERERGVREKERGEGERRRRVRAMSNVIRRL